MVQMRVGYWRVRRWKERKRGPVRQKTAKSSRAAQSFLLPLIEFSGLASFQLPIASVSYRQSPRSASRPADIFEFALCKHCVREV
ncbi:hypothetical protein BDQ12DRAFT_686619 [Crucibulum laeve]|uniref:Uncharacterized protein n=1 Tax=Crucibulum laeve TaxID=68775 RepID=A0A5C3LVG8_9AGAR|nr:hypothetical protein BDQ12DRAFT_686619 [Crucibulum laeve]